MLISKDLKLCELGNCELLLFEVWFYELLPWKWFNLNFKQGCLAKVYVKVNYLLSNLFCIFQDPLMRRLERCHVVPVGQILNNSVSGSGLNHSHYTITRTGEVVQQPRGNFIKRWCIFKYRNQCIQQINQNFSNKNVYQQQKNDFHLQRVGAFIFQELSIWSQENWCHFKIWVSLCVFHFQHLVLELLFNSGA